MNIVDQQAGTDQLNVSGSQSSGLTVSSRAAPITVTVGCTAQSQLLVNCAGVPRIFASLGTGDDFLVDATTGIFGELGGGIGNDRLTGGSGRTTIGGAAGDDTLDGGGGDDDVNGGDGVDIVRGGLGNDVLETNDGIVDSVIECEPDRRFAPGAPVGQAVIDLVDPQPVRCQSVNRAAKDQHPTVQVRGGTVRVRGGLARLGLTCPQAAPGGRCAGTAEIAKGKRRLARGNYRLSAGKRLTLSLRLRRTLGRAQVRTTEQDTQGRPETTQTTIVLRRAR